jgi:hypothetical protein
MTTLVNKPVLHGRDHCPGGPDPIPCWPFGSAPGEFSGVLVGTGPFAYWRLGETGSPWADTSGHPGTPANLTLDGTGTAPTPDVTGALASGDDGALEFNYDGTTAGGGRAARGADARFDALIDMSVCAWIKVKASATTRTGIVVGNTADVSGTPNFLAGWSLQVVYPGRKVRFSRGQVGGFGQPEIYAESPVGVDAATWYFVVGTFDRTQVRLYMNAVEVAATAHVSSSNASAAGVPVQIGGADLVGSPYGWFYGTADEVAVWDRALSLAEIEMLYASGVGGSPAGSEVLISDGTGGATWGKVGPQAIEPGSDGQVLQTVGDHVAWAAAPGGDPAADTKVWMPLVDSDGTSVLDDTGTLIPTLIPI